MFLFFLKETTALDGSANYIKQGKTYESDISTTVNPVDVEALLGKR